MSDRAIRDRYGYELETRDCLLAHGYDISEPPSEQTWLEDFNGGTGLWLPYWEIISDANISAADVAALKLKCPDPAGRVMRNERAAATLTDLSMAQSLTQCAECIPLGSAR